MRGIIRIRHSAFNRERRRDGEATFAEIDKMRSDAPEQLLADHGLLDLDRGAEPIHSAGSVILIRHRFRDVRRAGNDAAEPSAALGARIVAVQILLIDRAEETFELGDRGVERFTRRLCLRLRARERWLRRRFEQFLQVFWFHFRFRHWGSPQNASTARRRNGCRTLSRPRS